MYDELNKMKENTMKKFILVLITFAIILAGQAHACWNAVGISFEPWPGLIGSTETTVPMQPVRAYITLSRLHLPLFTVDELIGWDCCIEITGPVNNVAYTLHAGINSEIPPCFSVDIDPEQAFPIEEFACILVCTIDFIQISPTETSYIYIHCLGGPGSRAMARVTVTETAVTRNINLVDFPGPDGSINGEFIVPAQASTWGGVKALYR
ncbi:MAG: hypothetical protein ABIF77_18170 [bacterium]